MVTIQEAQQQVAQQQQQVEAERKKIAETRLPQPSKSELLKRTMEQRAQAKTQTIAFQSAKQKALAELQKYEVEQLQPYEVQISVVETKQAKQAKEVAQWAQARKLIIEGKEHAAIGDPSIFKKIQKLREGMPPPTITAPTIAPLTAYKHIVTGEMLYQTFRPEDVPKGYIPIAVSPTTLKELPAIEQFKMKLKKPELFAPKLPKAPTFDIREPYGIFGIAREKVEKGFEWAGERVSGRMLTVAERGVGKEIRFEQPIAQIIYTPKGEKVLAPTPKRKPIVMFGEAVTTTGKIVTLPFLGAERVTQLIFKPEAREEIFPSSIKPKVKFKERVTEKGIQYFEPITPLTVKERTIWLGEAALGVGIGVGAIRGATRFVKAPVVTYKPLPEPISYFKEVKARQPILVAGKEIGELPLTTYRIRTTRYTPEKIITTRAREFFKFKPKKVVPPIAKEYVTAPVGTIVGETPYAAVTTRITKAGKIRKTKLFEITGEQAPTTMAAFEKLPAYKQRMWQRTVEAKIGRPVSLENVPKMLREEERLAMGYIESFEYFGKPGKQITRAEVVSIVKPIKPPIEGVKAYKVDVGFKPIPKAFPRAAGEVPILPGKIIDVGRLKPIEIGKAIDISKFQFKRLPEGVPRARLTPIKPIQIQRQIQEPIPVPKIVPKFAKATIIKPTPILEDIPTIPKPLMVGGVGLVTIPFAGKGMYERTMGGLVPMAKPTVISDIKLEVLPRVKEEIKLVPKIKVKEAFKPIEALKVKQKLKTIQLVKQIPKLKALQKLKLIQKLKIEPALKMKLRQVTKPIQKVIPKIRVPPPLPLPKATTVKVTKDYKITKSEVGYDYYIRRAGKWIFMGSAETLTEASRKASLIVAGTLAAAFKVMRKKEVVAVPFGKMFRPAKREVGVVVQRRKFRLAAREEVKEIQWFKKKGSKTKWL